jgi:uncharacterized protein (TIGR00255 family)
MIRSMTAFARQQRHGDWGELTWEIRSVNHRYLEATVRLPEDVRAIEPAVRDRVNARLGRGKVECNLRFRATPGASGEMQVNERMVEQILTAAERMAHRLHSSHHPSIMDILRWPGVMEVGEQDFTPVQEAALALLDEALDALVSAREREGSRLAELIGKRLDAMQDEVEKARVRTPQVIDGARQPLRARLAEVMDGPDPDRIEQEMALLAQRLDVDEEMDRLESHVVEVRKALDSKGPVGRRLDFLMQELNREANTLSSKSADAAITRAAVEMKVLIEQMREQVQNLE